MVRGEIEMVFIFGASDQSWCVCGEADLMVGRKCWGNECPIKRW